MTTKAEQAAAEKVAEEAKAAEAAKATEEAKAAEAAKAAEEAKAPAKKVERIEEYDARKPDGTTVRVRHNIETGKTEIVK